jgi:hypothetical protein
MKLQIPKPKSQGNLNHQTLKTNKDEGKENTDQTPAAEKHLGRKLQIPGSKSQEKRRTRMKEQKILTKHPLGKSGKNISKQKYETLKKAILSALKSKELTHRELFDQLNKSLKNKFTGNISWYGETVKLDLEARKIIRRTDSKPQKYRLKST